MSTLGSAAASFVPSSSRAPRRSLAPLTIASLATLYLVWGSTYLAMRVAVTSFPPLALGAIRFTSAGALLFAGLAVRGAPLPSRAQWVASAGIGFLMMAVGLGTVSLALKAGVSSGVAALVFGTVPLWTAVFGVLFGRRATPREMIGLAIGFGGVALVATRGVLRSSPGWSVALASCAAAYALGCALSVRADLPKGGMATASQMLCAGAVLAAASVVHGEHPSLAGATPRAWLALAHLVFSGSILAYSALTFLLRTESTSLATSYAFVNPIIALVLGAWLGGERVTSIEGVGALLVVTAVVIVARARATAVTSPGSSGSRSPA